MPRPRIEVTGLGKSYGQVQALTDVSLQVGPGVVLGVLGHNGAGKTTLVDILATRSKPTSGTAKVCGWDVARFGHHVRRHIGMTSQFTSVDDTMTGRANLMLVARLLGASRKQADDRAEELLTSFDLTEAADRKAATYSGGMRRRLDLAVGMIAGPDVLFLDEPSTGLDPVSRSGLWDLVEKLAKDGTTIVLTTQYLEEADRLAHDIVVLAGGHVVASGTPERLKAGIGQRTASVRFPDARATHYAVGVLGYAGMTPLADFGICAVQIPLAEPGDIALLVRALDSAGLPIMDLTVTEPTLDDVYVALHRAAQEKAAQVVGQTA
ncbi:ATP-binding cassette domain-containing protein [Actinokineospora iranica]|uniref:ABC-2 type transport system ATP-binding protein n=1 Tax=Actinokineospora iranica TaxID=1271860 RepID=A0A1G6ZBI0_9PSEU|nr:ATP-binding cassette domain-containing protein [Actinokineospora iranica]SDD99397.1 ABC-2 type transport system ATP-binding protein [Actinokineospora iranica]